MTAKVSEPNLTPDRDYYRFRNQAGALRTEADASTFAGNRQFQAPDVSTISTAKEQSYSQIPPASQTESSQIASEAQPQIL